MADVNNLEEVTRIHQILLGAEIVIVEGLTNLDGLSSERVFFCALPLKIAGGDGAPCRAFASRYLSEDVEVLFEQQDSSGLWTGLTSNYLRVGVVSSEPLRNTFRRVTINEVTDELALASLGAYRGANNRVVADSGLGKGRESA